MNEKKTPRIRFKGFTDDWEQRKLADVAEIIGGGTPSTSNPDYWDGDIDWYAPAEIGEQIFAYGSVRKITKEGLIHSSAKILPAHKTVLFTSRAGIGNMAILKRPAATNQGFQSLVCHDDIDPYFMFSMGDSIKAKAERVAAGSTFAEISGKKLGELEFMFPDTGEQKAIGVYFKNLDHLITLHQRKYEKLQIIKKSMLENCFPKNGEKVPKIRFSGFTGDWEQRKLSEVTTEFKSGEGIKADEIEENGTYPVYGGNGLRGYTERYNHDGEYALIGRQGALCGNMNYSVGKAYFTEHAVAVKANESNDTRFLYYLLDRMDLGRYSDQSAQPGLAVNKLVVLHTYVPRKQEQEAIGVYFKSLDHLITLHQSELEKLQKIKKSMLERMFV